MASRMLNALSTENSPFDAQQLQRLKLGLDGLDAAQSLWLSGYLAGQLSDVQSVPSASASATAGETAAILHILYGSETGNGAAVAAELQQQLQQSGLQVRLKSLDQFRPAGLRKLGSVVFIMSTHGEGDPPEEAIALFDYLDSDRAPQLASLSYRVLALGDRSYEWFCAAGRRLDERLQALGAVPFGPRVDCDVDYQGAADDWSRQVLDHVRAGATAPGTPPEPTRLSLVSSRTRWSRQQPCELELARTVKITGDGSDKDVWHLELALSDSGLSYLPGDTLGVWAPNAPELVDALLARLELGADTPVRLRDGRKRLRDALQHDLEITRLSADTVTAYAEQGRQTALLDRFVVLEPEARRQFIQARQLIDLVETWPARIEAQAFVDLLRPLTPRSYSVASSQALLEDELHLTVATQCSAGEGVPRFGVASHYLNHRLPEGGLARVFPEPNRRFRLPEDSERPLIMIAAGTGIAPFRAFMQELEATGQTRETWLIYGNPHLRSDFLYQKEWLNWRSSGLLGRIDAAWSRDGAEKRYVQHVVAEQAERIDAWLQRGACVYLCGGLAMGQAVQEAIGDGLARVRSLDARSAAQSLADLRREKRLLRDLY